MLRCPRSDVAKSLQGGTLLLTGLRGADNQCTRLRKGRFRSVVSSPRAGRDQKVQNEPCDCGPDSRRGDRGVPGRDDVVRETFVDLALNDPDFTTASNVEESINRFFGR